MSYRPAKIRKNISVAKAEMERLKTNNKLTKKGKKNRAKLLAVCKRLSAAEPVNESQKSKLRKPKKEPKRCRKNEESRKLNRKFHLNPGGRTRKCFKKVKVNKECVRRLRKRVSSESCYGMETGKKWRPFCTVAGRSERRNQRERSRTAKR